MSSRLRRWLVATGLLAASLFLAVQSANSTSKSAAPPKPVLLPGEYPVTRFDLSRGSGTKGHSCIGHTTFGPGIAPEDLEVTYVMHNSIRIAIRGTDDALVCRGFYVPALRAVAHRSVFRFFDANRWSFEDIDQRANLRTLAPPAPAGRISGAAPAPTPGQGLAAAPASSQGNKCIVNGKVLYTDSECPKGARRERAVPGVQPGDAHKLPAMQRGLWKLTASVNGDATQSERCGDPLEDVSAYLSRVNESSKLGCTVRTTSASPRSLSLMIDCPGDRVSEDGSRSVRKARASIAFDSPSAQSFTFNAERTDDNWRESLRGVRVGNCE